MLGGTKEQFEELKKKILQDRLSWVSKTDKSFIALDLPHDAGGYLKITEDGSIYIHTWCDECGEYKSNLLAMGNFEDIEKILRAMDYMEDVE